jgi:large subunit ribosomal protein L13
MTKTTLANLQDHHRAMSKWWVVDARDKILGRMATKIARVLMGKHKPLYTPHMLVGDGVVVVNASNVRTTGKKRMTRVYRRYSGYPGGLKSATLGSHLDRDAAELIKWMVKRMLPKNRLGKDMLARLKVYNGADHPHVAQRPDPLEV